MKNNDKQKVLVLTSGNIYALGNSFIKGLQLNGCEVERFDLFKSIAKYERAGMLGRKINQFWPVTAWIRKANRELVIYIQKYKPHHILISGDNPILIGSLAFAKSIINDLKITLYWPDTLANLTNRITELTPLVDLLATYSKASVDVFKELGFRNSIWVPFAGDVEFFTREGEEIFGQTFLYDCSFIGGWRPERELVLESIIKSMPGIKLKIVGPLWSKRIHNKALLKYIDDKPRFGKDMGDFIRSSRINLNIIDDTNFPAANMRFFEIPAAGGLQLSSSCPELEDEYIEGKHIFYFYSIDQAIEKIYFILNNPVKVEHIRRESHIFTKEQHHYMERMNRILR